MKAEYNKFYGIDQDQEEEKREHFYKDFMQRGNASSDNFLSHVM